MEFEDMQRIWNKQDDVPLYAIDEAALYKRVQMKGRSTEFALNMLEGGIVISVAFSLFSLYINWVGDDKPWPSFLVPLMLIIIAGYVIILRQRRAAAADQFRSGLVGELEKAIAHNDFLLKRLNSMLYWYLIPVFGGFAVYFYFEKGPYWIESTIGTVLIGIVAYIGIHWELRKFHQPKQRDLEALRDLLAE